MMVRVDGQAAWRAFRSAKSDRWIAICDSMKLTAEADTWAELLETISETLELVVTDLVKSGDFERFLKEHGWRLQQKLPPKTRLADAHFDIPFIVARQSQRDWQAAAHQ